MLPVRPLAGTPGGATALTVPQAVQHALAAYQRGEMAEAERLCRRVLEVKADYFDALYLSGIIAAQTGRTQEAARLLSRAVTVNPGIADAHYNRGVALGELGRPADALESYERAIALKPDHADAYYNRGVALDELDRPEQALESYDRTIALRPEYAEAHNNRGLALRRLQRHVDALASYEQAIALQPGYARAYNNRGVALSELDRLAEALESYDRAIALKPDYVEAYNNRGIALGELDRPAEALESCERAIALRSDYADAFYNRGNAFRELHRYREAVDSYERALALKPDYASAHWNLADCYLLLGDFSRGWQEYEWRWKLEQRDSGRREFRQPLWLGRETLQGRTILLHSELGLGDTLLFCRYAKKVAALGAKVVLEIQPALLPLLADLEGVTQAVPRGAPLPVFDYHCPLMSLPLAFKTDLSNIPADIPYIRSDVERVAAWQAKLGRKNKPRVGVVWSGSTALRNDKRSMTLRDMLALLREWAEWISLQKEVRESETALLASRADLRHVGAELKDFGDTAALVELMDVLVTVDTSVAHVAGAMGKPVWIFVPFNPHDWRWMLDREDSMWYPTARLFRQPENGDWASVVGRVNEELVRHFGAPR
ncbi:MAG: tetratricopeptide repeat protein [Betaproteobacteria bacterium]|nr:MAG: tetratricopeptide repeat protein [Betaproteobacteria bacterium]